MFCVFPFNSLYLYLYLFPSLVLYTRKQKHNYSNGDRDTEKEKRKNYKHVIKHVRVLVHLHAPFSHVRVKMDADMHNTRNIRFQLTILTRDSNLTDRTVANCAWAARHDATCFTQKANHLLFDACNRIRIAHLSATSKVKSRRRNQRVQVNKINKFFYVQKLFIY